MRMPNIQESGCDSFAGSESRVWKILPEFIRKKSGTNKKRQAAVAAVSGAGGLKLTESVCSGDTTADTKNDECRVVVTAAPAPQPPAKQSHTKKSLDCRRSWTYGYCDSGPAAAACDNSDTGDGGDSVQVRVARELQREHSFPGQFSGALTKTEARRRLLSWKRTTIARKNSEQQY